LIPEDFAARMLNSILRAIEDVPFFALLQGGERMLAPHTYRLPDGHEISIDIVFTPEGERILDPSFDLEDWEYTCKP